MPIAIATTSSCSTLKLSDVVAENPEAASPVTVVLAPSRGSSAVPGGEERPPRPTALGSGRRVGVDGGVRPGLGDQADDDADQYRDERGDREPQQRLHCETAAFATLRRFAMELTIAVKISGMTATVSNAT